jgi:hypothetical protein
MKKIHAQLYTLTIALILIVVGTPVSADTGLIDVDFHGNIPLFAEANILPGDGVTRAVTVTNESDESQDVYLQLLDAYDQKGFGDVLELTITDGSTTFLDSVVLSTLFGGTQSSLTIGLSGGDSVTYDVTIAFTESAGNEYQEGEAGFDFCVGFSGGAFGCDGNGGEDPNDSPEEETPVGGGRVLNSSESGGGSGEQGGSKENLIIENEGAENTDGETGSADVTWDTNKPATSRVVCGPAEDGPYTFDLDDEHFGYPWGTEESDAFVTEHLVPFIGLDDGVYLCRASSREDGDEDWTVSSEFSFTLQNSAEGENSASFITTGATPIALAQTDDTGNDEVPEEDMTDEPEAQPNNQVAGVFSSIDDALAKGTCNIAWWIWILVIVAFLIITTWTRELLTHLTAQDSIKRLYVFSVAGVVVFFIALFTNSTEWILPMGVGTLAVIIATIVDAMQTREGDVGHVRLVRIIISLISVLLATLLVALVLEWTCAIIPLVVSIIILAIRYALHKGAE